MMHKLAIKKKINGHVTKGMMTITKDEENTKIRRFHLITS